MKLPVINKLLSQRLRSRRGFTMIELLVVISIIGVLAVAVLSSINPIEQINKGRDTRTRSDAAQLVNAIDRYLAIHEEYPWNTDDPVTYDEFSDEFIFDGDDWAVTTATDWPYLLVSTSEVKSTFIDRLVDEGQASSFIVYKEAGFDTNTSVCFVPSSNAFRQEAAGECNAAPAGGILDTICATRDGSVPDAGQPQNHICVPGLF